MYSKVCCSLWKHNVTDSIGQLSAGLFKFLELCLIMQRYVKSPISHFVLCTFVQQPDVSDGL